MTTTVIILVLFSYLLGSIPTGYLIAKRAMGIDIRQHGSGNPGAVNAAISRSHCNTLRFNRFIPAPSPKSIGASPPQSTEQRKELTRWTRPGHSTR